MERLKLSRLLVLQIGIALLPVIFYIIVFNQLPEVFTTHYSFEHGADGFSHKWSASVLFMVFLGFLCLIFWQILIAVVKKFPNTINDLDFKTGMEIIKFVSVFMTVMFSMIAFSFLLAPFVSVKPTPYLILRIVFSLLAVSDMVIGNLIPHVLKHTIDGVCLSEAMQKEIASCKVQRFISRVMVACGTLQLIAGIAVFIQDRTVLLFQLCLYPVIVLAILIYAIHTHRALKHELEMY